MSEMIKNDVFGWIKAVCVVFGSRAPDLHRHSSRAARSDVCVWPRPLRGPNKHTQLLEVSWHPGRKWTSQRIVSCLCVCVFVQVYLPSWGPASTSDIVRTLKAHLCFFTFYGVCDSHRSLNYDNTNRSLPWHLFMELCDIISAPSLILNEEWNYRA